MSNSASDVDVTSEKLANLSVSERSPLQEILPSDERIQTHSPRAQSRLSPLKSVRTPGSRSEQDGNHEDQVQFNKLVKKAKHLAQDGKVREALELNRQALKIHHHEKLARRIAKMEEYLKNYGDEDEEDEESDGMVEMGQGFYLYKDLCSKLYSHQKQGVLWMWGLHKRKKGGILGDDMGLGKTIQVIAFLSGMFDMEKMKHALIVVPVSVMVNWEKEFSKWAPGITVSAYHGSSKRERERSLDRVRRRGGILLTTYGMVVTSWEQLANADGREFIWDYVILDEGHKIKNPTKTTKGIHAVGAKHRIILTGTPIQNNLKELWTLFDYVHQGSLLGTLRTFKMEFENPIIRARERDATGGEKRLGLEMAESLKKIIAPFFLRRTKAEVKNKENQAGKDEKSDSIKMPKMMYKNDFVVWLYLSETQLKIYQDFLQLDSVKELLTSSKSPLVALTVLKKICDHPRLLSVRACHQLGLHGHDEMDEDELELPSSYESAVTKVEQLSDEVLKGEAGKMGVLLALLDQLREEGHRCLIFSQSRRMLDIIQKVLRNMGHKVIRLDGTVNSLAEREQRVQKFQKDGSYSVFLLTTQVGGVGLTLTAADRVVIYDPSWNPATDAQAVDRAFRIGQTRNVVVYRLITCGTVEEKIYRRQIFKDSITRQTTGGTKDPYRYFTKQELRELFQLDEPRFSSTQQQLEQLHGLDRRRDPELDTHIAFLHSLDIFGISDHDLMFSQESLPEEEEEEARVNMPNIDQQSHEYIKHRVQKAKEIIERESSVPGTMEQRFSTAYQHPPVAGPGAPENRGPVSGNRPGTGGRPHDHQWQSSQAQAGTKAPDIPLFIPSKSDSTRIMYNRLPGQPNVFRVEIQKPPQQPQPPHPVKTEVKPKATALSSESSDVVDLTEEDDEEVEEIKPAVRYQPEEPPEEDLILPVIEKKREQKAEVSSTEPITADTAEEEIRRLSIKEENIEDKKLSGNNSVDLSLVNKATGYDVKAIKQEDQVGNDHPEVLKDSQTVKKADNMPVKEEKNVFKSPLARSGDDELQKRKSTSWGPTTPKATPAAQRVIEEELIISPNAYTPLLHTRQKRRRVINSPTTLLDRSLAFGVKATPPTRKSEKEYKGDTCITLVDESPERSVKHSTSSASSSSLSDESRDKGRQLNGSSDELQSFLNEEDQSIIEESFVATGEDGEVDSPPIAGNLGDDEDNDYGSERDNSDARAEEEEEEQAVVKKNRRRSVCRKVAVIESSEEEDQDDEDKENLHPSFSSKDDDERSLEDPSSDNTNNNADPEETEQQEIEGEAGDSLGEEEDGGEEDAELAETYGEVDDEADDEDDEENQSVVVYDESIVEEEEEAGEEEDDGEEEEVDMEKLQQLLREAKSLYKQKRYREAKQCVDAALDIIPDPDLMALAEKIQSKIDAGL